MRHGKQLGFSDLRGGLTMQRHHVVRVEANAHGWRARLSCGHDVASVVLKAPRIGEWLDCAACPDRIPAFLDPGRHYQAAPATEEIQAREEARRRGLEAIMRAGLTQEFRLRTKDHPGAAGNATQADRRTWTFTFPLEDGRTLSLEVGASGKAILERLLLAELLEHACGSADPTEDR